VPETSDPGLGSNGLSNDGLSTRTTKRNTHKRRAQVRRRRWVGLSVVILVLAVAIAVPLVVRGGNEDERALSDGTASLEAAAADGAAGEPAQTSGSDGSGASVDSTVSGGAGRSGGSSGHWWYSLVLARQEEWRETAKAAGANELGLIPVLMYARIADDAVPPQRLRDDIASLEAAGFYPTTVREMVEGTMDIPLGKSPIVLTFDDSSPTQFQVDLEAGTLDPDCAVAILQAAVNSGDWASKASFFPLLEVNKDNILFGQPDTAEQKLRDLVDWGYEVGSHTTNHRELSLESSNVVRRELAVSKSRLEEILGEGYEVFTLAPPYGELPDELSLLTDGEYEGTTYHYSAVVMYSGGYSSSPFSSNLDATRIPRIDASADSTVPRLISYFQNHPVLRYVSDGNPRTVSFPQSTSSLLGQLRGDLTQTVLTY
jgi:hypothetical protein